MRQTVEQNSSGAKCLSLVFHAGHNSNDKDVAGVAEASQKCETVTKAINNLKQVLFSEIPQVKNGHHGRESNNIKIEEFIKYIRILLWS